MAHSFAGLRRMLTVGVVAFLAFSAAGMQPVQAHSGADLAAHITGKRWVRLGQEVTYTVSARNVGGETAQDVTLDGWVPDWFNFVSVDCRGGTLDDSLHACHYPDLAAGKRVSMTITVQACCPEPRMYELGFAGASNDVDPANDVAEIPLRIGPAKDQQSGADLAARLWGKRWVREGERVTYALSARNVGDATAQDVVLEAWVMDWFTPVRVDCRGGTLEDTQTCRYPDLAPGQRAAMTFTVQVTSPQPEAYLVGFARASNDVNPVNDFADFDVRF